MTRVLSRRIAVVLGVLTLSLGSFLATSAVIHIAKADDAGKPRGRNIPEPLATLSPQERAQAFKAGPRWDGAGRGGLSDAQIANFQDYPLFWLGESFAGYNLQTVRRVKYSAPPGAVSLDRVGLIYGECIPAGSERQCPVPAQVHVQPVCSVVPGQVAEGAKQGAPQSLAGGAILQRFVDGHIMVWTGAVAIEITVVADPALVNRAFAELRGLGRNTHGPGQTLPPPNFSEC